MYNLRLIRRTFYLVHQLLLALLLSVTPTGDSTPFSLAYRIANNTKGTYTAPTELDVKGQCGYVASTVLYEFVTVQTGKIQGYPIREILYARIRLAPVSTAIYK